MNLNEFKFSPTFMKWARDLFPLCRSLTGEGNRKTLKYIKSINSKFLIKAFRSNKKVFDWKIPREWKINEAYSKDYKGKNYVLLDISKKLKISFNNLNLLVKKIEK